MGIGSSVARKLSIDVSGTNNNVMVIDGVRVHYDWSLLLDQIRHLVVRENRMTVILLVTSGLIFMTALTVLAIIGFFRLSSMLRSLECRMLHGFRAHTPVTMRKQATSITIHRCEGTMDRVCIHTI